MNDTVCRITSMRVTYSRSPARPKPKAGDRRTTKKNGVQIRVQCMARDFATCRPIGRLYSGGRPVYAWRKPRELDPWDYYLLTRQERAALEGQCGDEWGG